jgi:CubicO group peptidase (beta-lactamase class C family)
MGRTFTTCATGATTIVAGDAHVEGIVAPGFESVVDVFARHFDRGLEVGAAFAVHRGDETLIDVWGGLADRQARRRWCADTTQPIFSGTKALVAICLLLLIERGQLELDAPVARYWPEFRKPHIRVRHVVSHTARLPGVNVPVTVEQFFDDRQMADVLAWQSPSADPRAERCYHPMTFGWLCGELVRRIDGRSVGRLFAEDVAGPLDLELWIGLPEALEARVARLELADDWPAAPFLGADLLARDAFLRSIWTNPPVMLRDGFVWNRRDCHAAEIPAAGAIGTVRSVAKLYAQLDQLLDPETIALGHAPLSAGWFETIGQDLRFGVGFQLSSSAHLLGPVDDAFGHTGAGTSVHGCWPLKGIGFSYAMNLMRDDPGDRRAWALLHALHEVVR